jgi:large subunit ribosomal protein L1
VAIGRRSFTNDQILDNLLALTDAIQRVKPEAVKGVYCNTIALAGTMTPGIRLDVAETFRLAGDRVE